MTAYRMHSIMSWYMGTYITACISAIPRFALCHLGPPGGLPRPPGFHLPTACTCIFEWGQTGVKHEGSLLARGLPFSLESESDDEIAGRLIGFATACSP